MDVCMISKKMNLTGSLNYLRNKHILVTDAGGSVGSELCRQLLFGDVSVLFLFGQGENSIYQMDKELRLLQKVDIGRRIKIIPVIGDLKDAEYMIYLFEQIKIDIVFHTAAYKHVPLMDENPMAVMLNSLFGTQNIIQAAQKHSVERFVHLTTDKAVDPVSVYGASKLLCELLVLRQAENSSKRMKSESHQGKYIIVRFGNVFESCRSIVSLFQQQIDRGGPVTVTHPDMYHWFVAIPEACPLILQSGGVGDNGDLYILDNGEHIRRRDLAEEMIKFYGLGPNRDIKIEHTSLRPGKLLGEKLWAENEEPDGTSYNGILRVRHQNTEQINIESLMEGIEPICYFNPLKGMVFHNTNLLRSILLELIPSLNPYFCSEK